MAPRTVLERRERFSQSCLWRLQRAFFNQRGLAAWSEGIVPHYVTSNPRMAIAYVHMALAFLQASFQASSQASARARAAQRVYIVELGAGSGRFAYRFLKKLQTPQPASAPRITYVITDIAERTLEALQAHPLLQPFIADGRLDFACFDVEQPAALQLRHAGTRLSADTLDSPLIAIANYVFDGVAQDCFAVRQGRLHECLVTTSVPRDSPTHPDDPELLGRVRLAYSERPVLDEDYYADPDWNAILQSYAEHLPDSAFLFPTRALSCLRFLRELSHDRLLVLTADKGVHRLDELAGQSHPRLSLHGSFSMPVNYHAIGEYVIRQGGHALQPRHQPTSLRICAYMWGLPPDAVQVAYDDTVEHGGPDDFYALKQAMEPFVEKLSLSQMLSYLRLSGWDNSVLHGCELAMHARLDEASDAERVDLAHALEQVWDQYLPIGEQEDLAFVIGTLMFGMQRYDQALAYFERSRAIWGPYPATAYNAALCHKRLGSIDAALHLLDEALELDPEYTAAAEARRQLLSPTR